jgi:hypothetical protein
VAENLRKYSGQWVLFLLVKDVRGVRILDVLHVSFLLATVSTCLSETEYFAEIERVLDGVL